MRSFHYSSILLIACLGLVAGCKSKKPPAPAPAANALPGVPLTGRSADGKQLSLQDGSTWAIQPVGQANTLFWAPGDRVQPKREMHPSYAFVLVNHSRRNFARARLLSANGLVRPPQMPVSPPPFLP